MYLPGLQQPEIVIVQRRKLRVGRRSRVGMVRGRRQAQFNDPLPGIAPVEGRSLTEPPAWPATGGTGNGPGSPAQVLTLLRQQANRQGVRNQHHTQRDVEADNRSDQLVDRIRDLAGALHQHRSVILCNYNNNILFMRVVLNEERNVGTEKGTTCYSMSNGDWKTFHLFPEWSTNEWTFTHSCTFIYPSQAFNSSCVISLSLLITDDFKVIHK